jgi:hypothetical protein
MSDETLKTGRVSVDMKLSRQIAQFLIGQNPHAYAQVSIAAMSGAVRLQGNVTSHEAKLEAATLVSKVAGVRTIRNELVVDEVTHRLRNTQPQSTAGKLFDKISVGQLVTAAVIIVGLWIGVPVASAWRHVEEKPPLDAFPIELDVFYDDKPAAGAQVVLHPRKFHNLEVFVPRPSGMVDHKGRARIKTFQPDDGAPEGEYTLTITWNKMVVQGEDAVQGQNLLDHKFSSPASSPFRVNVKPGKNVVPPLRLSS